MQKQTDKATTLHLALTPYHYQKVLQSEAWTWTREEALLKNGKQKGWRKQN